MVVPNEKSGPAQGGFKKETKSGLTGVGKELIREAFPRSG